MTVLAVALVWFGLTAPDRLGATDPVGVRADPARGSCCSRLLVVVLPRAGRPASRWPCWGSCSALLTVVKVLDLGFFATLDRPFDSVVDWRYLGSAVGLVDDSLGRPAAVGAVLLVALAVVAAAGADAAGAAAAGPGRDPAPARHAAGRRSPLGRRLGALRGARRARGAGRAGRVDQHRRRTPSAR